MPEGNDEVADEPNLAQGNADGTDDNEQQNESGSGDEKLNAEDSEMSCESGGETKSNANKKQQKPKAKAAAKKKPAAGVRKKPSLRRLKSKAGKKRKALEKTSPNAKKAKTDKPASQPPRPDPESGRKKEQSKPAASPQVIKAKESESVAGENTGGKPGENDPDQRLRAHLSETLRAKRARWIQDLRNVAEHDKRMTVPEDGVLQSVGWGPDMLCVLPARCVQVMDFTLQGAAHNWCRVETSGFGCLLQLDWISMLRLKGHFQVNAPVTQKLVTKINASNATCFKAGAPLPKLKHFVDCSRTTTGKASRSPGRLMEVGVGHQSHSCDAGVARASRAQSISAVV